MPGQPRTETEPCPAEIRAALPQNWNLNGSSLLDLDAAAARTGDPPLPHPDASFQLIWSVSTFTAMHEGWAAWLLEARRLLADGGLVVIRLLPADEFVRLSGSEWDSSRIGMTVLAAINGPPAWAVFHSDWWLREHWGRAFKIVSISSGPLRAIVMRDGGQPVSPDELAQPRPAEQRRELSAALANAELLRAQLGLIDDRHRRQLEDEREEIGRELMRRSFAAADREWSLGGPGSPAALVAAEYEATTSWRLTRPLRAIGALVRRVR